MRTPSFATLVILSALLATGCVADSTGSTESVDSIGAALEQENGGLEMTDEAPAFGDDVGFAAAGELEEDPTADDAMRASPELGELAARPDIAAWDVAIVWGQIPGDRTQETPRNWSGAFVVDRGGMLVERVARFEGITDRLLPRSDPRIVAFTSVTLPHHDGLLLRVLAPAGDPAPTLGYVAGLAPEARELVASRSLDELGDEPVELLADDAGNRMMAIARPRIDRTCERGTLRGVWHRVAEGRGVIRGRVTTDDGTLVGHVRGVYGVRRSGEHVFFAKFVDLSGRFRGILGGHYGDGHFAGRWLRRDGDHGVLRGAYREAIPGPETGGLFLGVYADPICETAD